MPNEFKAKNGVITPIVQASSSGSAGAPSITKSDDLNTGIYFPAADTIAFTEGGVEAARIDSAGNFGIANTTPKYRLDVLGSSDNFTASFGSSIASGTWSGIHFGYLEPANTAYRKSAIVFERQDGSARGKIHILNDSVSDAGSAVLTDSKVTIQHDGNVGIGVTSPAFKLEVNGSFAATTKSFVIDHPTKPDKKLRYGSLEGPENGVYVRGKLNGSNVIELPEYWTKLVDPDSITVHLTPMGKIQNLYVKSIKDNKVFISGKSPQGFYIVYAERCDVEKLEVEV